MTRRERVLKALNFEMPDQLPKDLGGMFSTGISAFAYPKLVKALGLNERPPKVADIYQMLALPDKDVLDALDCDVVMIVADMFTNASDEPDKWHSYDFNQRLPALVQNSDEFSMDGTTIVWSSGPNRFQMPPDSFVFDPVNSAFDLDAEVSVSDLKEYAQLAEKSLYTDDKIASIKSFCRRARESTDRAIMISGICAIPAEPTTGGYMASTLPLTDPEGYKEMNRIMAAYRVKQFERLLPAISDYVDIYMVAAHDLGIQTGPFLPPEVIREIHTPYYRAQNDAIHRLAPGMKTFLHSCGGVYDIIDDIIAAGFDILNPVQWSAGGHSYKEWKDKCRNRITLWGGGVNSQTTLPLGTVRAIEKEVSEVVACLKEDGGFVFNSIHNILAEIAPEKIIAMYAAAKKAGRYF